MVKKFFLLSASLLMLFSLNAQDQSNFTQFYTNPYLINPSYAGVDGQSAMSLIYRKQWMNIDGGPTIANFNLHTPVNTKTNVGLSFTSDSKAFFNNSAILATYGYVLPLKNNSFVRFGLSLGGAWNTIDMNKLEGVSDPTVAKVMDNHASVAGNAGISFRSKAFNIGLSMPGLFSSSYISESAFEVSEVKPFQTLILNASNRYYFAEGKHIFEPHLVYRLSPGLPSQFEGVGVFHVNHLLWLGGSYKQDFGVSALGGIKLKNMIAIGGSYSFQNTGSNELNSPSFEITLNYLFGKHKKGALVFSFVNTDKPKKPLHHNNTHPIASNKKPVTKTETVKPENKQQPVAKNEPAKQQPAKNTPVKNEPAQNPVNNEPVKTPAKDPVATPVKSEPVKNESIEVAKPAPVQEGHHEHEQEQLQRLEIHADNPTEHHDGTQEHPHAERHEFVKRGNHEKELDVSDYVVGGVFGKEANAKHFSEGLDKLGFDTHYGHLTEKNLWYVFVYKTDNIEEAKKTRDQVRKTKLLKDAWLLTVHH